MQLSNRLSPSSPDPGSQLAKSDQILASANRRLWTKGLGLPVHKCQPSPPGGRDVGKRFAGGSAGSPARNTAKTNKSHKGETPIQAGKPARPATLRQALPANFA